MSSRFLSQRLALLESYIPGEQPRDKQYIKLNTNESPYAPSPLVERRVNGQEIEKLRLYPDPECINLKEKLAAFYGVKRENVFVSNGSDEVLSFCFLAFCGEERGMAFPDISYGFYEVYAELYGIKANKIPLKEDFSIDAEDYFELDDNIVIANPNAPTGLELSISDIERIVKKNCGLVIIDEAYVDFGGESSISLTKNYDNILVVGTFSKSRSMAGARIGFAIGSREIIEDLEKIKYSTNPYNVNRLSQIAGEAALDDSGYYAENAKRIIEIREYTARELLNIGFTVIPSKANFIFAKYDGIGGRELYLKLKERGVLVRQFERDRIRDYLRITIGTKEQMNVFLDAVKNIIGGKDL